MLDSQSLFPALKRAVRTSMGQVQGAKQRDVAFVWRGYLEALRVARPTISAAKPSRNSRRRRRRA
jgi:hypothetical protein